VSNSNGGHGGKESDGVELHLDGVVLPVLVLLWVEVWLEESG